MSIKPVRRSSAFPPQKNGGETCVKIAALSALLVGIVYSAFSVQRFFFPLKTVLPNAGLGNREIVPISKLKPAEIAIPLDPLPQDPKENLRLGLEKPECSNSELLDGLGSGSDQRLLLRKLLRKENLPMPNF